MYKFTFIALQKTFFNHHTFIYYFKNVVAQAAFER